MNNFVYVANTYRLLDKNYTNPLNHYLINKYLWNFNKFFIFIELFALNYTFGWYYFFSLTLLIMIKTTLGFLVFFKPLNINLEIMHLMNFNGNLFEEYTSLIQDLSKILYFLIILFCLLYPSPKNIPWFIKVVYFFIYLGVSNYCNISFLKKYQQNYLIQSIKIEING